MNTRLGHLIPRFATRKRGAPTVKILILLATPGLTLRVHDAGQHAVEGFFFGQFLAAGSVLAIFVLRIAGAAEDFQDLLPGHGDDGVVHGALAAGAIIVDGIAQTHEKRGWLRNESLS